MALPEAESQGGGIRGGPRRWTGKGPRPARHIPWPELFKHHQSVLTGHLKMMDMVRKHCVEGSGNHTTAQACVDRTHEMLRMFKKATATFIPPKDNLDKVPLGASSASMYPGYSPADHIYGEAASEFGKHVASLKKQGVEFATDPNGPEYDIAAEKKAGQEQIGEIKRQRQQHQDEEAEPMEGVEGTDPGQLFMIDSNPTPVASFQAEVTSSLTKSKNKASDKAKRRTSNDDGLVDASGELPKKKKLKVSAESEPADEFEAEVEAKHNEKEERRKAKKEKKRKRDSEPSDLAVDVPAEGFKTEKPKKKKSKKEEKDEAVEDDAEVDREAKKRKKKSSEESTDAPKKKKKTVKEKETD